MLTIQPVSANQIYSKRPVFKGHDDSIEQDRKFLQDQLRDLDQVINDDVIPEKIKKPFKFFRVLGAAALEGVAVFGSVMALVGMAKRTGAKINNSEFSKKASEAAKPVGKMFAKGYEFLVSKAKAGFELFKKTKLGQKTAKYYHKFAASKIGKAIIGFTKQAYTKASEFVKNMFSKVDGDKATKATATTLGVGSGISGAYEEAVKNSEEQESSKEYIDEDEFDIGGDET